VRERLFPPLLPPQTLADEETVSMGDDWAEYVRPELESHFDSERRIVSQDLADAVWMDPIEEADPEDLEQVMDDSRLAGEKRRRVTVPVDHTDAWYSTLNQARLLMHEEHHLADSDERLFLHFEQMGGRSEVDEETLLLAAQYDFYSALQSILVENVMNP